MPSITGIFLSFILLIGLFTVCSGSVGASGIGHSADKLTSPVSKDIRKADRVTIKHGTDTKNLLCYFPTAALRDLGEPINIASQVASVDLNHDGSIDLVVTDSHLGSHRLHVLINNGDGTFDNQMTFQTGRYDIHLATGDLNHDGNVDLVTANRADNTISVLLGNGDGSFHDQLVFPTGTNASNGRAPSFVAIGDFNSDHNPDVAVANTNGRTVGVLLGNGDGTFQTPHLLSFPGGYPSLVAAAELNGDGHLDLIAGDYFGGVARVCFGDGQGNFAIGEPFSVGTMPINMRLADLNSDGNLDLVVPNLYGNTVSVLLGNGNGSFGSPVGYRTYGYYTHSANVGDVNQDGVLDLVAVDATSNADDTNVAVLLGIGDGTFEEAIFFSSNGRWSLDVATADLNGDGWIDLAASNGNTNSVAIMINDTCWPHLQMPPHVPADTLQRRGRRGGSNRQMNNRLNRGDSSHRSNRGNSVNVNRSTFGQTQRGLLQKPKSVTKAR